MFAFGLKKKDSRRICLIAGLLLLHISCASAAAEMSEGELRELSKKAEISEEADPIDAILMARDDLYLGRAKKSSSGSKLGRRNDRLFRFTWKPENESWDLPEGWVQLTGSKQQTYYRNDKLNRTRVSRPRIKGDVKSSGYISGPELMYYELDDTHFLRPKKIEQGLKVYAGLYYRTVDECCFRNAYTEAFSLRLWSATLSSPQWLDNHGRFKDLEYLEDTAQRIDNDSRYWVQRLEFFHESARDKFIERLRECLPRCVNSEGSNGGYTKCKVMEIRDPDHWTDICEENSRTREAIENYVPTEL